MVVAPRDKWNFEGLSVYWSYQNPEHFWIASCWSKLTQCCTRQWCKKECWWIRSAADHERVVNSNRQFLNFICVIDYIPRRLSLWPSKSDCLAGLLNFIFSSPFSAVLWLHFFLLSTYLIKLILLSISIGIAFSPSPFFVTAFAPIGGGLLTAEIIVGFYVAS